MIGGYLALYLSDNLVIDVKEEYCQHLNLQQFYDLKHMTFRSCVLVLLNKRPDNFEVRQRKMLRGIYVRVKDEAGNCS